MKRDNAGDAWSARSSERGIRAIAGAWDEEEGSEEPGMAWRMRDGKKRRRVQ